TENILSRRVGSDVVRPLYAIVISCAHSGRRYRPCAVAEYHSAAEGLPGKILSHLKRLRALGLIDARNIPAARQVICPVSCAEMTPLAERQVVDPVRVQHVPAIIK